MTNQTATIDANDNPETGVEIATGSAVMASLVSEGKKAATKVENYSKEVTEKLLGEWAGSTQDKAAVELLAKAFGKTTRSIVAKLSREKVYVAPKYVTKAGTAPVSKEEHVNVIAAFLGLKDPSKLESLEKANKGVLVIIETGLQKAAHIYDNETSDSPAEKASKDASIAVIVGATGAMLEDLKSLKLAKAETLQIIARAFEKKAVLLDKGVDLRKYPK